MPHRFNETWFYKNISFVQFLIIVFSPKQMSVCFIAKNILVSETCSYHSVGFFAKNILVSETCSYHYVGFFKFQKGFNGV